MAMSSLGSEVSSKNRVVRLGDTIEELGFEIVNVWNKAQCKKTNKQTKEHLSPLPLCTSSFISYPLLILFCCFFLCLPLPSQCLSVNLLFPDIFKTFLYSSVVLPFPFLQNNVKHVALLRDLRECLSTNSKTHG